MLCQTGVQKDENKTADLQDYSWLFMKEWNEIRKITLFRKLLKDSYYLNSGKEINVLLKVAFKKFISRPVTTALTGRLGPSNE